MATIAGSNVLGMYAPKHYRSEGARIREVIPFKDIADYAANGIPLKMWNRFCFVAHKQLAWKAYIIKVLVPNLLMILRDDSESPKTSVIVASVNVGTKPFELRLQIDVQRNEWPVYQR